MTDAGELLPDAFARAARLAPVPLEARTLLHHLGPWSLRLSLARDAAVVPLTLRQLVKLALLPGHAVVLDRVDWAPSPGTTTLSVSRAGKELTLTAADLGQDLRVVVHRLAAELTLPAELVQAGEAFAMELAREETVRKLGSRMLQVGDLDEALHAMLLGITSGYGASLHRAALFTYDEPRRTFRGSIAIGPRDEAEAHRIWEAIETEDKTLDQALDDYRMGSGPGSYQDFVRTLEIGEDDGAELRAALASRGPLVFRAAPENATLGRLLAPAGEFVLSVIQPRGTRLGLIVADNAYGGLPIVPAQLEFLGALVDPLSLVWETRSLLRRVDMLARHDPLTGLYNRRELDERFLIEQSRCERVKRPISLLMIDFDHFKQINDTRGHDAGDVLLRRVGVLLQESLRQHDVACRYGGDEFVVMLPECSKSEMLTVTTRVGVRAHEEGISLSIGGATWPDDSGDAGGLLALADAQLYAAKAAGRCCASIPGSDLVRF